MRTVKQMVMSEVLCCVTSLVEEILQTEGSGLSEDYQAELSEAKDRAETARIVELIEGGAPCDSRETAVCEDIAEYRDGNDGLDPEPSDLHESLDLDYPEVYEWWAVTDWLSEKLAAAGEIVLYQGVALWGRQATGQSIAQDPVIIGIHADMVKA